MLGSLWITPNKFYKLLLIEALTSTLSTKMVIKFKIKKKKMLRFYFPWVKVLLKIKAPSTILTWWCFLFWKQSFPLLWYCNILKCLIDPSACWAQKEANTPSPRRTRSVKCPTQGPAKTIKSSPHSLAPQPTWRSLTFAVDYKLL